MAFASSRIGAQEAIIKPCDLCEDNENVNWFCKDCVKNLCDRCRKGHLKIDICKNHFLVPILEGIAIIKENISNSCQDHNLPFTFFCRSCETVVCSRCLSRDHNKHMFVDIHEFQSQMQNELNGILKEKERESDQLKKNLAALVEYEIECRETLAQNYIQIDDMVKAIQIASAEEGNDLKKELELSTKEQLKEAMEDKKEIERNKSIYDEEIRSVRRNLKLQPVSTLKQFVKISVSKLQSLKHVTLSVPTSVRFTVGNINKEHIRDMIGKEGKKHPSKNGEKGGKFVYQKLKTISVHKLDVKTYCYSICSSPDDSVWIGGKGYVYKMNCDCSVTFLVIPTPTKGTHSSATLMTCHYIACLHSGDAIVSYGGNECTIDKFMSDGRRIEYKNISPFCSSKIAVTDLDEVVVGVCNPSFSSAPNPPSSLEIFSNNGNNINKIKIDESVSSFCIDNECNFIASYEHNPSLTVMDRNGIVLRKLQIKKPSLQRMTCDGHGNILGLPEGLGVKEIYLVSPDGKVERSFTVECVYGINDFCIDSANRILILVDDKKVIDADYLDN